MSGPRTLSTQPSMEQVGAHDLALANRLIEYYPHKAAELLARIFKDEKIKNEANACFIPPPKSGQPEVVRSPNRVEVVFQPRQQARSLSSQDSGSPPPPQRRRHHISDPAPSILSPPRTASSTGSRSIKGEAASRDYILITGIDEHGTLKEKPVRMRTAPIPYSIIRDDVANRLHADIDDEGEAYLPIPDTKSPTRLVDVPVNSSITLTWCRPKSDATHETRFYIVSKDLLMADVLLGYEDSGERPPGYSPGSVLQPRSQEAYIGQPAHQVRPPAPTPPPLSQSHHRSAFSSAAYQVHPNLSRVEEFVAQQNVPSPEANFDRHSQQSTPHTIIDSRAPRTEYQSASLTPDTGGPHSNSSRKLRLELSWGLTVVKTWLALDNPAEAFFEAFQKQVKKQRILPDRSSITIYLKTEQHLRNDATGYPLSLDQEDLEADWAGTVRWLEANSRDISPHAFGTIVEVD